MPYWTEDRLEAYQDHLDSGFDKFGGHLHEGWWAIPTLLMTPYMHMDPLDRSNFRSVYRHLEEKLGEDNVDELWAYWYMTTPQYRIQFNPEALPDREAVSIVIDAMNEIDQNVVFDEEDWDKAELEEMRRAIEWEWDDFYGELSEEKINRIIGLAEEYTWDQAVTAIERYKEEYAMLRCSECGFGISYSDWDDYLEIDEAEVHEELEQYRRQLEAVENGLYVPLPGIGEPALPARPLVLDSDDMFVIADGDGYVCPRCLRGKLQDSEE